MLCRKIRISQQLPCLTIHIVIELKIVLRQSENQVYSSVCKGAVTFCWFYQSELFTWQQDPILPQKYQYQVIVIDYKVQINIS